MTVERGRRVASAAGEALDDGRDGDARVLYERALQLFAEAGDGAGVADAAGGIGLCRMAASANAEAVSWFRRAITRSGRAGAFEAELGWRMHLDESLMRLRRHEERVPALLEAIDLARRLGRTDDEAALWALRVACCEDVGDQPGAAASRAALAAISRSPEPLPPPPPR